MLVKHFCIFSIVSSLFICNSILFSRFWIIFTIIILNSFPGILPISSSFVWIDGFLTCFFSCWTFFCLFILFRLLCLGCCFCRLEVHGSSLLCSLIPVGEDRLVSFQGILVVSVQCLLAVQGTLKSLLQHHSSKASIACVCVLVVGAGSLVSGMQGNVQ